MLCILIVTVIIIARRTRRAGSRPKTGRRWNTLYVCYLTACSSCHVLHSEIVQIQVQMSKRTSIAILRPMCVYIILTPRLQTLNQLAHLQPPCYLASLHCPSIGFGLGGPWSILSRNPFFLRTRLSPKASLNSAALHPFNSVFARQREG